MPDPFGIVKNRISEDNAIPKLAADARQRIAQYMPTQPTGDQPLPPGTFKVDMGEQALPPRKQTPNPMDVVSSPSKYYGLPKDIAKVMEMTDSRNASLGKRMLGADLPKFAYQLGAGATEAATLGTLTPGFEPETTGEAVIRGIGNLFGSAFVPLGPVVKGAAKLGYSKTIAGAAANVVAAEIQTRGQASASRLMLDATFGALFGKFYNTDLHWTKTPVPGSEKLEAALERGTVARPAAQASARQEQLLLPDYSGGRPGRTDFIAGEAGIRPVQPNIDVTGVSPLQIEGEGLFKELGIRRKGRTLIRQQGDAAQRTLNKLGLHSDADVRETARMAKTFMEHTDPVDTADVLKQLKGVRNGSEPPRYAIDLNPGEDPFEVPRSKLQTGITSTSSFFLPKRIFADVERDTGGRIKGYTDVFLPGQEARQIARVQTGKVGKAIADEIGGLPASKQEGILAYHQAVDDNTRTITAHAYNLTEDDIAKSTRAYGHIEELWKRNYPDHSFHEFMSDTLPRMRHATPADREVLKFSNVANEMENYAANHEFSVDEKRFDRFSAGLIRSLSMKEHFDPFYRKIEAMVSDRTLPQEYRNYVADWGRGLRGTDNAFSRKWTPRYQQFLRRLGVNADSADIRDVIDNYIQLTHSGLVGFRAAPVFKNLFNGWQTGAARIGPKWFWKGVQVASTEAGYQRSLAAGMIDEAAHEAEAVRQLGAPGAVTKGIRKISAAGLSFYGKVDDYNRSHIFNGMYEKVMDAALKSGTNEEKFLRNTGLYRFHEVVQNEVVSAWRNGNVRKAAELAGVHAAQDTQWVYRTEYRPTIMGGEKARALMQFGVWPINYFEYTRQMFYPGAIKNMPSVERAKWIRDWAFTNASIVALFGGTGAALGIGKAATSNALKWTGLGPLSYGGGPALDMILALPQAVANIQSDSIENGAAQTLKTEPWRRVKSNLASVVPMSGLARDIARAKGPFEQGLTQVPVAGPLIQSLESQSVLPSKSSEEEMFRLLTGVGVHK